METGLQRFVGQTTKIIAAAGIGLMLNSCGWFTGEIDDQEVKDLHAGMRAQKRTTVFDGALRNFGHLLRAYDVPHTAIQSKNVGNMTGEKNLPSDLYTMIASSLNKIGHQVTFIPYDVQYVVAESTTGGKITRVYPKIVISGGLTGFDKEMFEKQREAEASGGWAGAQGGGHLKASGTYSRLTLDLNMLNYRTQTYFPGVIVSNSIALTKSSLGWGIYGYYMGNGAAFDYDLKEKQGVHAALRTLVEFSLMQLLGKYFVIPYWRIVKGANPDPELIAHAQECFLEKSENQQQLMLKKMLFLHGYKGMDLHSTVFRGSEDGALKEAMRRYKVSSSVKLYMALWENVSISKAEKIVRKYRRTKAIEDRKIAEQEQKLAAKRAEEEKARKIAARKRHEQNVKIYNVCIDRGNNLYKAKKYIQAQAEFAKAHQLFSQQAYPVKMLNYIKVIQQRQKQADTKLRKYIAYADSLYRAAEDASFKYTNYKKALNAYSTALSFKPSDTYLQGQVKKIKQKLSKYNTVYQMEGDEKW